MARGEGYITNHAWALLLGRRVLIQLTSTTRFGQIVKTEDYEEKCRWMGLTALSELERKFTGQVV